MRLLKNLWLISLGIFILFITSCTFSLSPREFTLSTDQLPDLTTIYIAREQLPTQNYLEKSIDLKKEFIIHTLNGSVFLLGEAFVKDDYLKGQLYKTIGHAHSPDSGSILKNPYTAFNAPHIICMYTKLKSANEGDFSISLNSIDYIEQHSITIESVQSIFKLVSIGLIASFIGGVGFIILMVSLFVSFLDILL